MANSVDPDEMAHSAVSHLGLNCLLRPAVRIHMVNIVRLGGYYGEHFLIISMKMCYGKAPDKRGNR